MAQLQARKIVEKAAADRTDRSQKFYYYEAKATDQPVSVATSPTLLDDVDSCFSELELQPAE